MKDFNVTNVSKELKKRPSRRTYLGQERPGGPNGCALADLFGDPKPKSFWIAFPVISCGGNKLGVPGGNCWIGVLCCHGSLSFKLVHR
jgi:hypothetical protein